MTATHAQDVRRTSIRVAGSGSLTVAWQSRPGLHGWPRTQRLPEMHRGIRAPGTPLRRTLGQFVGVEAPPVAGGDAQPEVA